MIELLLIIAGLLFVIWILLLVIGRLWYRIKEQPKTLEEMRYKILEKEIH